MTKAQAVALAESEWWIGRSAHDVVMVQLFEPLLCMPFAIFHGAVQEVLGRPVWTHEFASSNVERLKAEFLGDRAAPTMDDIIALIPEEKRMVLMVERER